MAAQHGQMVAYCDVDESSLEQAKKLWPDAKAMKDFRKVMERDDIHLIVNDTKRVLQTGSQQRSDKNSVSPANSSETPVSGNSSM